MLISMVTISCVMFHVGQLLAARQLQHSKGAQSSAGATSLLCTTRARPSDCRASSQDARPGDPRCAIHRRHPLSRPLGDCLCFGDCLSRLPLDDCLSAITSRRLPLFRRLPLAIASRRLPFGYCHRILAEGVFRQRGERLRGTLRHVFLRVARERLEARRDMRGEGVGADEAAELADNRRRV